MPDSNDLVARVREANSNSVGNSVYSVSFDQEMLDRHNSGETPLPLFGTKYMFHLEGVVDCPEFLVNTKKSTTVEILLYLKCTPGFHYFGSSTISFENLLLKYS